MTGRHREQPKAKADEDGVDERAPRTRRVVIVAVALVVPVLVASVIAVGMRKEPARERPETAGTPVQNAGSATPEPTYEEYVPPESEPQVATKTPRRAPGPVTGPRKTAAPGPSPSPTGRVRRPCPAGWDDVWWMRRWCERHGHRDR